MMMMMKMLVQVYISQEHTNDGLVHVHPLAVVIAQPVTSIFSAPNKRRSGNHDAPLASDISDSSEMMQSSIFITLLH